VVWLCDGVMVWCGASNDAPHQEMVNIIKAYSSKKKVILKVIPSRKGLIHMYNKNIVLLATIVPIL